MPNLNSLLARDRIVPVSRIQQAIQRQVIVGGSLETILLELGGVAENVLVSYSAAVAGVAPASSGDAMYPESAALESLPVELALKHSLVPLAVRDGALHVGTSKPIEQLVLDELEHETGLRIAPRWLLEVRLEGALLAHYGREPSARSAALLQRLDSEDAGALRTVIAISTRPGATSLAPETQARIDAALAPQASQSTLVGTASPAAPQTPEGPRAVVPSESSTLLGDRRSSMPPAALSSPTIRAQLEQCETRDEVLASLVAFAQQFFSYVVLFGVHDEVAEGRDAFGAGASLEKVKSLRVPLTSGMLARARRTSAPCFGRLDDDESDRKLASELGRDGRHSSVALPIALRGRVILLLWGDCGGDPLELSTLGELLAMTGAFADALERLIVKKKARESEISMLVTRPGDAPSPLLAAANPRLTATPVSTTSPRPFSQVAASVPPPTFSDFVPDLKPARRVDPRREDDSTTEDEVVRPSSPPRPSRVPWPSLPPSSMSLRATDMLGRSIIVDMGEDVEQWVERLTSASPEMVDAITPTLLDLGERSLPALVQRFPGPLWVAPGELLSRTKLVSSRDLGPVPRALSVFRLRAASYVVPLIEVDDAMTRTIALLVSADIAHPMLVPAIGRRLLDVDFEVATLATRILPRFARAPEYQTLLLNLRESARNPALNVEVRKRSVWALAELRDTGAMTLFMELLESGDEDLVLFAERALIDVAKQDFGKARKRWETWHAAHGSKHRVEWLIEALLHADERVRSEAATELKRISQEYFGFHPSAPRKERERVHKRYVEWWNSEGSARFSRS